MILTCRIIAVVALVHFTVLTAFSQNVPVTTPVTYGSGAVSYPLDFGQGANTAPAVYNISRVYQPLVPMTTIPTFSQTGAMPVLVNTVYSDGFERPLMSIQRNGSSNDIITPYDYRTGSNTVVKYLPYADDFNSTFQNQVFTDQKNFYSSAFPNEQNSAYAKFEQSSLNGTHTSSAYQPGRELVTHNRGVSQNSVPNTAAELFNKLEYTGGSICISGTWAAGTLIKTTTQGQNYIKKTSYTDKSGKVIADISYGGNGFGQLLTYYLYNELGQLQVVVPPKAYIQIVASSCISNITDLCFVYTYDDRGNLIEKHIPGKTAPDYFVYDKQGRVILSQTPSQRNSNLWSFVLHDRIGRVVMQGIYTGNNTRQQWQDLAYGITGPSNPVASNLETWVKNNYFENVAYPSAFDNCEIYLYNYYDTYDQTDVSGYSFHTGYSSYYLSGTGIETPQPYGFAQGKLVLSKTKILAKNFDNNFSDEWITSVYFYDERNRTIQVQTSTPWNTWDIATTQYNFLGQKVLEVLDHNGPDEAKQQTILQNKYVYEPNTARLHEMRQKIDEGVWKTIATYTYNNLGQVSTKWMGGVEEQHLRYNIRGEFESLNNQELWHGWNAISPTISFMENICRESGYTTPRYDGRTSGVTWRTRSSFVASYGYDYDYAGRLIKADFNSFEPNPANAGNYEWNKNVRDFSVENLTYDQNGNILTMKQRGFDASWNLIDMDDLTYDYGTGNRLLRVEDAGGNSPAPDFNNLNSGSGDYTYDANGNLTSDANKGITSMSYNYQNLPEQSVNSSNDRAEHIYLANGGHLQQNIFDHTTSAVSQTTYWGPFVYQDNQLQYFMQPEGRVRYIPEELAGEGHFQYDYFIKDHWGNVRTVITAAETPLSEEYLATHEIASANIEETMFENISEVRDIRPEGTPGNVDCAELDGSDDDRRVGTALILHVMTGDKINMKTYSYHEGKDPQDIYAIPDYVLSSLITAFGNGNGGFSGGEANNGATSVDNMFSQGNYDAYDELLHDNYTDPAKPRAYINYVVFNENMEIVLEQSGAMQVSGTDNSWELLELPSELVMKQNGYIAVYISNEQHQQVWFDNVTITQTHGTLQQEQHYYPHGLQIWQSNDNTTPRNKFSYQGNESRPDIGLNLSNFNFRQYDQQIGLFTSVDPLADASGQQVFSPYHFCGNDPVNIIDPLGLTGTWLGSITGFMWGLLNEVNVTAKRPSSIPDRVPNASFYSEYPACGNADPPGGSYGGSSGGVRSNRYTFMGNSHRSPKGKVLTKAEKEQIEQQNMEAMIAAQYDKFNSPPDDPSLETEAPINKTNELSPADKAQLLLGATDLSLSATEAIAIMEAKNVSAMKTFKVAGKALFVIQVGISASETYSAFTNNDANKYGVAAKATLDVAMGVVGFFGPIGLAVSGAYFIADAAGWLHTDWGKPAGHP